MYDAIPQSRPFGYLLVIPEPYDVRAVVVLGHHKSPVESDNFAGCQIRADHSCFGAHFLDCLAFTVEIKLCSFVVFHD